MTQFRITPPLIVVLASGKTDGERNHQRGHLFEEFIAKILEIHGYESPTRRNINVRFDGFELDLVTRHRITRAVMVVECKAYTTNIRVGELTSFKGKLEVHRYDEPNAVGLFVAIPGLTADGEATFRKIEQHDKQFLRWSVDDVVSCCEKNDLILLQHPSTHPTHFE